MIQFNFLLKKIFTFVWIELISWLLSIQFAGDLVVGGKQDQNKENSQKGIAKKANFVHFRAKTRTTHPIESLASSTKLWEPVCLVKLMVRFTGSLAW